MQRKIVHVDMDCFYAAIEARDKPELSNKPLAVGGDASQRGVVCTCNYIARKYRIHSAMATAYALQLCPDLVVLKPNMALYRQVSRAIQQIFYQYTLKVEPLSLDEAYLDVSDCSACQGSATLIAKEIKAKIFASQGLIASAGVAPNKFLAKVASDWQKPNGLFVITPSEIVAFVQDLPVTKLFGVGKVMATKLAKLGVEVCSDLQKIPLSKLLKEYGAMGARLYELARGIDNRPVETERERKSLSVEHTFAENLLTLEQCLSEVPALTDELQRRLQQVKGRAIAKQFIKLKFSDFSCVTREQISIISDLHVYQELLQQGFAKHNKAVRLIGLGVRFKEKDIAQTLDLPGL